MRRCACEYDRPIASASHADCRYLGRPWRSISARTQGDGQGGASPAAAVASGLRRVLGGAHPLWSSDWMHCLFVMISATNSPDLVRNVLICYVCRRRVDRQARFCQNDPGSRRGEFSTQPKVDSVSSVSHRTARAEQRRRLGEPLRPQRLGPSLARTLPDRAAASRRGRSRPISPTSSAGRPATCPARRRSPARGQRAGPESQAVAVDRRTD